MPALPELRSWLPCACGSRDPNVELPTSNFQSLTRAGRSSHAAQRLQAPKCLSGSWSRCMLQSRNGAFHEPEANNGPHLERRKRRPPLPQPLYSRGGEGSQRRDSQQVHGHNAGAGAVGKKNNCLPCARPWSCGSRIRKRSCTAVQHVTRPALVKRLEVGR